MTATSARSGSKSGLTVHRGALRDLGTLVQQRRAMWRDLGIKEKSSLNDADRLYEQWARTRLKKGELMAWIVEDQETVAGSGCLWLQPVQPRPHNATKLQPYLLSMYTDPNFRRRGVASLVVQEAIDWCRKKGYQRLTLHASEMGRKVYQNLGFKRTWEMRLDLYRAQPRRTKTRHNQTRRRSETPSIGSRNYRIGTSNNENGRD